MLMHSDFELAAHPDDQVMRTVKLHMQSIGDQASRIRPLQASCATVGESRTAAAVIDLDLVPPDDAPGPSHGSVVSSSSRSLLVRSRSRSPLRPNLFRNAPVPSAGPPPPREPEVPQEIVDQLAAAQPTVPPLRCPTLYEILRPSLAPAGPAGELSFKDVGGSVAVFIEDVNVGSNDRRGGGCFFQHALSNACLCLSLALFPSLSLCACAS